MKDSLFETIAAISRPTNIPSLKPEEFKTYQEAHDYLIESGFVIEQKYAMATDPKTIYKKGYEDSAMHDMQSDEVIEYANRLRGIEPIKDVMTNEKSIPIKYLDALLSDEWSGYQQLRNGLIDLINKQK